MTRAFDRDRDDRDGGDRDRDDRDGGDRDRDDRAVSEVLGYVFVFSMVVASVGILYVSGVGTLTELRHGEQLNNADRAFVALAENFDDVHRGRGSRRAGEIRLGGGRLTVDDSARVQVQVTDGGTVVGPIPVGQAALVYEFDDRAVHYESGAVFRSEPTGSIIRRDPAFLCTADHAIVSGISVTADGNVSSVQRSGTVLVAGERRSADIVYPTADVSQSGQRTVNLTVTSANAAAWDRYLTSHGWTGTAPGPYSCTAARVTVRETVIAVEILP